LGCPFWWWWRKEEEEDEEGRQVGTGREDVPVVAVRLREGEADGLVPLAAAAVTAKV
jgi:hypothetical protein